MCSSSSSLWSLPDIDFLLIMTVGNIPTIKIAFGTDSAVGATGNMKADCGTKSATVGMYASSPDVSISFQ